MSDKHLDAMGSWIAHHQGHGDIQGQGEYLHCRACDGTFWFKEQPVTDDTRPDGEPLRATCPAYSVLHQGKFCLLSAGHSGDHCYETVVCPGEDSRDCGKPAASSASSASSAGLVERAAQLSQRAGEYPIENWANDALAWMSEAAQTLARLEREQAEGCPSCKAVLDTLEATEAQLTACQRDALRDALRAALAQHGPLSGFDAALDAALADAQRRGPA